MSTKIETTQNDTTNHTPIQPETGLPAPKSRKGLWILLTVLALLIIGASAAYYFYQNSKDEEVAFEILENNENVADYEDFLQKFPNSHLAPTVAKRLEELKAMLADWQRIQLSDKPTDFVHFKEMYANPRFTRLCDIKIDSLDWVMAQRLGTQEAFQHYLDVHPDGRYASEASVSQGTLRDREITPGDRDQIMSVITDFYRGFENRDETLVCSNITPSMTQFLSKKNATKSEVLSIIKGMFNEHIQKCEFVINRDFSITRSMGADNQPVYTAVFSVDQHIQRDNEGKTFGSYKATAIITSQLLISSLTMQEISASR